MLSLVFITNNHMRKSSFRPLTHNLHKPKLGQFKQLIGILLRCMIYYIRATYYVGKTKRKARKKENF